MIMWQYVCNKCGTKRSGLLAHKDGIGGYSWACPDCKSHDIRSYMVLEPNRKELTKDKEVA